MIIVDDEKITVAKKSDDSGYEVTQTIESNGDNILALGDINGDTFIDIVVASTCGEVKVFTNDGAGDISELYAMNVNSGIQEIRLTDADWDWDLDLELIYTDNQVIHTNDGSGHFQ